MGLHDILVSGRPSLAVLIDPEKQHLPSLPILIEVLTSGKGDIILVGGSTEDKVNIDDLIIKLKSTCPQPIMLFPGHRNQLSPYADYILLPSIISGSSFKYLIGEHIESAQEIHALNIPIISTGYILTKGDRQSSTVDMTQSRPIDTAEANQLLNISLAGEMIGLKSLYIEAGSGASDTIHSQTIVHLKKALNIPLIVGGGIRSLQKLNNVLAASPNMIVIGNILEEQPEMLDELYARVLQYEQEEVLNWSKSTQ